MVTLGAIPFIGLVVPNLVSRLIGDNLGAGLPLTASLGALLVLGADMLGRVVRMPYEIPASAMTGVNGAALFLALILRAPKHG